MQRIVCALQHYFEKEFFYIFICRKVPSFFLFDMYYQTCSLTQMFLHSPKPLAAPFRPVDLKIIIIITVLCNKQNAFLYGIHWESKQVKMARYHSMVEVQLLFYMQTSHNEKEAGLRSHDYFWFFYTQQGRCPNQRIIFNNYKSTVNQKLLFTHSVPCIQNNTILPVMHSLSKTLLNLTQSQSSLDFISRKEENPATD